MSKDIRKPKVAGQFYPASPPELKKNIQKYFNQVESQDFAYNKLYGVIAPHAGFIYSGAVAAYSYQLIAKTKPARLIIIAPSHREFIEGFSIYPGQAYSTPLGEVNIDQELVDKITDNCSAVERNNAGHKEEHSLEVQLPFLQNVLEDFSIVPIVAGNVDHEQVRELGSYLAELDKKSELCLIASSDLSHFHSYESARNKDRNLIEELKQFSTDKLIKGHKDRSLEACGMIPISVLLEYARELGDAKFMVLDYRNSGDTAGGKSRVVGYLAAAIYK